MADESFQEEREQQDEEKMKVDTQAEGLHEKRMALKEQKTVVDQRISDIKNSIVTLHNRGYDDSNYEMIRLKKQLKMYHNASMGLDAAIKKNIDKENDLKGKFYGHIDKAYGHAQKANNSITGFLRRFRDMGLPFHIIFIIAIIIESGLAELPFGPIDGLLSSTLGIPLTAMMVINIFLLIWYFVGTDFSFITTFLLGVLLAAEYFGLVGSSFFLVVLLLFRGNNGRPIDINSFVESMVFFIIILMILFAVVSLSGAIVGYADTDSNGDGSSGKDAQGDQDQADEGQDTNIWEEFMCALNPIACQQQAQQDNKDEGKETSGVIVVEKDALRTPVMTKSEKFMPGETSSIYWEIENDGEEPIYDAVFMLDPRNLTDKDGSIEAGNVRDGGLSGYPSLNGFDEDILDVISIDRISGQSERDLGIYIGAPGCSEGSFRVPSYFAYDYSLASAIMLEFAGAEYWQLLDVQEKESKIKPQESRSTIGPFELSIYPIRDNQPIVINGPDEMFGIVFKLTNRDDGRAAINQFNVSLSKKLVLDSPEYCPFEKISGTGQLNTYTLKDENMKDIGTIDINKEKGFNQGETREYRCSFTYDEDAFEQDLGTSMSTIEQRYISASVDYTYLYEGMLTIQTDEDPYYELCEPEENETSGDDADGTDGTSGTQDGVEPDDTQSGDSLCDRESQYEIDSRCGYYEKCCEPIGPAYFEWQECAKHEYMCLIDNDIDNQEWVLCTHEGQCYQFSRIHGYRWVDCDIHKSKCLLNDDRDANIWIDV